MSLRREHLIGEAMIRQAFDHMAEGKGPPEDEDLDRMYEEAEAIASNCIEAEVRVLLKRNE